LSSAYLVNELGNWLGEVALAIVVFDQTGSPLAVAGLFLAMQFAPALATPPLIARIDAVATRRALAGLYAAEAVAFVVLAALASGGSLALALILVVAAIDGTLATAARARTRATGAAILQPAGLLREGNAILNFWFTAAAAAGPAIAGLVVTIAGPQVALLADAGTFLGVAALLATSGHLPGAVEATGGGWAERLRRGLTYARERPVLRRLLGAEALAFVFFALVLPIEVAFAKDTLDAGDAGYGFLLGAWGTGMVLGSVAFGALSGASLRALLAVGTLAIGVAYCGTGLSPSLLVACAFSALGGAGNGLQWVALVTAVQAVTASEYQARVVGLLESLASGASGLGFLLGGAVAAVLTPREAYVVAGAGVLVVLAIAASRLRQARFDPGSSDPGPALAAPEEAAGAG
jgi:hypothetical protein